MPAGTERRGTGTPSAHRGARGARPLQNAGGAKAHGGRADQPSEPHRPPNPPLRQAGHPRRPGLRPRKTRSRSFRRCRDPGLQSHCARNAGFQFNRRPRDVIASGTTCHARSRAASTECPRSESRIRPAGHELRLPGPIHGSIGRPGNSPQPPLVVIARQGSEGNPDTLNPPPCTHRSSADAIVRMVIRRLDYWNNEPERRKTRTMRRRCRRRDQRPMPWNRIRRPS